MTNVQTTDEVFSFNILPLYSEERNVNSYLTFGLKFYKDEQCTFLQPLIKKRLMPNPVYAAVPSNELLLFKLHDQIRPENIEYYLKENDLDVKRLNPMKSISTYFDKDISLNKEHIHIIVSTMQQSFLNVKK